MSKPEPITVSVEVPCNAEQAWLAFTDVSAIQAWNFASPDWHCPGARNDLKPGGSFSYRMEARDGSMGFDYEGVFTEVSPHRRLAFTLGPEREVLLQFLGHGSVTEVRQSFTPDSEMPIELQRAGWQAIMENYRKHVVALVRGEA